MGNGTDHTAEATSNGKPNRTTRVSKKTKILLDILPKEWTVVSVDESIFVYETVIRAIWAPRGSRPTVFITGSHLKTFLFGALSLDGRQMFRQYQQMNGKDFVVFLKSLKRKFKKFVLFYDGAPQHRAEEVKEFLRQNLDSIIPVRFPRYSPEYNAVEEPWRQAKNTIGATYHPTYKQFKSQLTKYIRTTRFKLNMVKYLCH